MKVFGKEAVQSVWIWSLTQTGMMSELAALSFNPVGVSSRCNEHVFTNMQQVKIYYIYTDVQTSPGLFLFICFFNYINRSRPIKPTYLHMSTPKQYTVIMDYCILDYQYFNFSVFGNQKCFYYCKSFLTLFAFLLKNVI